MKLIGIIRVSSKGQRGKDDEGLERQRASLRRIASRQKAKLTPVEVSDVSGSDLAETPEWKRVVRLLKDPDTHLAIDHIDRLNRSDGFDFQVLVDAQRTSSRLYTETMGMQDLDKPMDVFITKLMASIGGLEKGEIKRRVWNSKEEKRRRGEFPQSAICLPYGVHYDRKTRQWSYTPKSEKVKEAYRLFVQNGLTLAATARAVGARNRSTIRVWLRNTVYKGYMTYSMKRGREAYPKKAGRQPERKKVRRVGNEVFSVLVFGPSEQLVSDETWDAAQSKLNRIQKTTRKRRERGAKDIPYSGFLYSALEMPEGEPIGKGFLLLSLASEPRHVLYGKHSGNKGKRYTRYQCRCSESQKFDPGSPRPQCGLPRLLASEANKALDVLLHRMCAEKWFSQAVLASVKKAHPDLEQEKKRVKKAIEEMSRQRRRLLDLHLDGAVERADYDTKLDEIRSQLARLEKSLARISREPSAPSRRALKAFLKGFKFDPAWTADEKRDWLAKHIVHIIVAPDGINSVLVKLPVEAHGEYLGVMFSLTDKFTWEALVGYDIRNVAARLEAQGLYFSSAVALRLGIRRDDLAKMIRAGKLKPPAKKHGTKWLWTEAEIGRIPKLLNN